MNTFRQLEKRGYFFLITIIDFFRIISNYNETAIRTLIPEIKIDAGIYDIIPYSNGL